MSSNIFPHLQSKLLQQRGDNRKLVAEIRDNLSPEAQERLFRVLQGLEGDCDTERRKRRQGQFW